MCHIYTHISLPDYKILNIPPPPAVAAQHLCLQYYQRNGGSREGVEEWTGGMGKWRTRGGKKGALKLSVVIWNIAAYRKTYCRLFLYIQQHFKRAIHIVIVNLLFFTICQKVWTGTQLYNNIIFILIDETLIVFAALAGHKTQRQIASILSHLTRCCSADLWLNLCSQTQSGLHLARCAHSRDKIVSLTLVSKIEVCVGNDKEMRGRGGTEGMKRMTAQTNNAVRCRVQLTLQDR